MVTEQRKLSVNYTVLADPEEGTSQRTLTGAYDVKKAEATIFLTAIWRHVRVFPRRKPNQMLEERLIEEIIATDIHETIHHCLVGEWPRIESIKWLEHWAEERFVEWLVRWLRRPCTGF